MKDLVAGVCMIAAAAATLALLGTKLAGQPLNLPLFLVAVALWVSGAVIWRLDD